MTLTEFLATHNKSDLFEYADIDEPTQDALMHYFRRRRICDEDPEAFIDYFSRTIEMYAHQYNEQLRIETIQFDPMVADYMERLHNRKSSTSSTTQDKQNVHGSANSSSDGSNSASTTDNGTDVTNGTHNERTNDTGHVHRQGTVNGSVNSGTQVISDTNGSSISNTNDSVTRESTTDELKASQTLKGDTPDSSMYGVEGMPDKLNWQFTSGQGETREQGSTKESGSENHATGGNENHQEHGTTDTQATSESAQNEDEYTEHDNNINTGGESRESRVSNHNVATQGTDNRKSESTESRETIGTSSASGTGSEIAKERYSGRHEAPQDLMDRAISYIRKANAFRWLVERLDSCFFGVL